MNCIKEVGTSESPEHLCGLLGNTCLSPLVADHKRARADDADKDADGGPAVARRRRDRLDGFCGCTIELHFCEACAQELRLDPVSLVLAEHALPLVDFDRRFEVPLMMQVISGLSSGHFTLRVRGDSSYTLRAKNLNDTRGFYRPAE